MPDLSFNFGVVGEEVVIGALRQIGESAVDAAAAAVNAFGGALINTLKEMVSSTAAVETQQASLVALLNSTGMAAGMTQAKVNDLAMQFRDLAGGSAEAVVGIEEIALRAGTISANQMPEFIKVVADLGTVMGNTTMAATILARAQDDPVGAFTRLERITGVYDLAVKENIKTLVKHGETAEATAAIMDFVARATGGSAAAAADTLSGKWSILTGHFETFLSTIGGPFVAAMENLLNIANPTLDGVYKKFEDTFMPLITDMAAWGQALVEVFAEGMQSAFGLVVDVINQLGSIIASLMAPGSPPKFLPLLDVWGRQAVDVYLAGWTTFDKSVFDEIGKAIKAGLDAQLIHDYANTMHQLADANTAVSEAQDALNALTARYDGMITPLSEKLKGLQNQDQIMADQKTLAGLQNILGDANASAAEKAQARRQIEEIHLKEQIAGLDLEKNTAVNSAKEKINVAQQHQKELAEQAKLLTTQIDIQAELNSSIHQGTAAVAGLHGALKAIPPTLASLGGAAGDMKNKIDTTMNALKESIQEKARGIIQSLRAEFSKLTGIALTGTDMFDPRLHGGSHGGRPIVENMFQPMIDEIHKLFAPNGVFSSTISTALDTIKNRIGDKLKEWAQAFIAWVPPMIPILLAEVEKLAGQLLAWVQAHELILLFGLAGYWGPPFIEWVAPMIPPLLEEMGKLAAQLWDWIQKQVPPLVSKLLDWGASFVNWVGPQIPPLLTELGKFLGKMTAWMLDTALPGILLKIGEWEFAFMNWVMKPGGAKDQVLPELSKFLLAVGKLVDTDLIPGFIGFAKGFIGGLISGLQDSKTVQGLTKAAGDVGDKIISSIKDAINNAVAGLISAAVGAVNSAISAAESAAAGAVSTITGLLGGHRADGGPVVGGSTYWVGERGPELFTAPTSGTIIPNHSLSQASAPGGPTLNFNIDARGSQMSEHDFKRVIEKTLSEAGQHSDHLSRMGFS